MSPILTRPVREQFEHDRIIRLLQARYRRKFEVAINPGAEQNSSVGIGEQTLFPDVLLFSQERGRRLQGTIEVETGESVNTLEALSQWALFSRLRAPFMLYVPPSSLDAARRLCAEHHISVSEIWTYHTALDQIRFTMVHRATVAAAPKAKPAPAANGKPAAKKAAPVKAAAAKPAKPAKLAKPVSKAASRPAVRATAKKAVKRVAKAAASARKTVRPAKRR